MGLCHLYCRSVHGNVGLECRSDRFGACCRFAKEDTMIAEFARTLDELKDKLHTLWVYL